MVKESCIYPILSIIFWVIVSFLANNVVWYFNNVSEIVVYWILWWIAASWWYDNVKIFIKLLKNSDGWIQKK